VHLFVCDIQGDFCVLQGAEVTQNKDKIKMKQPNKFALFPLALGELMPDV